MLNRDLAVFSGSSNPSFAHAVCDALKIELGRCELLRFSDGEISVEIGDNVRGRDVFVVQSTSNPGNDHLMELLIMIDALKRASAWRVTAVIPYYGYARQDRKLKPRVPISAKLVADLLTAAGASRVLTMDLHAGQIMGFFDVPVDNLNSLPVMLPHLAEKYGGEDLTIVSPDMGGVERARNYATKLGNVDIAVIDKRRSVANQVAEMKVVGEVAKKTCIIVDDMVDTAGTLTKAAEELLKRKAKKVLACCTHPVLSGNAHARIRDSVLEELVITDSIPYTAKDKGDKDKVCVLSVSELFADAIQRIHSNDSISSLFK